MVYSTLDHRRQHLQTVVFADRQKQDDVREVRRIGGCDVGESVGE